MLLVLDGRSLANARRLLLALISWRLAEGSVQSHWYTRPFRRAVKRDGRGSRGMIVLGRSAISGPVLLPPPFAFLQGLPASTGHHNLQPRAPQDQAGGVAGCRVSWRLPPCASPSLPSSESPPLPRSATPRRPSAEPQCPTAGYLAGVPFCQQRPSPRREVPNPPTASVTRIPLTPPRCSSDSSLTGAWPT